MSETKPKPTNWKVPAAIGYTTIFIAFFGFGGWSAFAALDSAIISSGVVSVETNRKTIQHYEGGIVKELLVREGQHVEAGDIMFRLDSTQGQANLSMVENQYRSALAQEARLRAERLGAEEIEFPEEVLDFADDPLVAREIADQEEQFRERRASLLGQTEIIDSQIDQLGSEIGGLEQEQLSAQTQIAFVQDQLEGYRSLLEKRLIQRSVVLELERENATLQGVIGRSTAEIAKARTSIAEAELQKSQLSREVAEEVNTQILEVRQRIAELRERITVASDVFTRLEIAAPLSGTVQNLAVFTVGAVIRAGEPLLDIVPDDENLIVQAEVSPLDVDNLTPGMEAEIRLPSFQAKQLPVIFGSIRSVSSDRLVNEQSGEPYFLALIEVEQDKLPADVAAEWSAGLPAEVIIPTGERTALEYFWSPLEDRLRKSFREE